MSDFGRGLTYCLGLFLAHTGLPILVSRDCAEERSVRFNTMIWFNGAGDHIFEMQIPKTLPKNLQRRLARFKKLVLGWRLIRIAAGGGLEVYPTNRNKVWAIAEAKELLLEIDRFYGIEVKKADLP